MKPYKNGFLLGKFYPFHKGHVYLIEKSLELCNHLTVLVCALDDDKEFFISGEARFKAMCEYFEGYKNLTLIFHQNNDPQYPEEHLAFWNIWLKIILSNVDPSKLDVVFSSEEYGNVIAKRLQIKHHCIDLDRSTWPISGTKIRRNIVDKWDFLPQETKRVFIQKIAFIGPESVGKSTISQIVANHFGFPLVKEYGREHVEKYGNDLKDHDFQQIVKRQNANLVNVLNSTEAQGIICDTENVTTYTFYDMYVPMNKIINLSKIPVEPIDLRILFYPDNKAVQDGTRRFIKDEERLNHYKDLRTNCMLHGYNCREVSGTYSEKIEKSIALIENLLKNRV